LHPEPALGTGDISSSSPRDDQLDASPMTTRPPEAHGRSILRRVRRVAAGAAVVVAPPEVLGGPRVARAAKAIAALALPKLSALAHSRLLTPRNVGGGQLPDTRWLLQVGLGLGLAYLLFLALWFWGTRGRRGGRVGGTGL
jgi:hypothetical protein